MVKYARVKDYLRAAKSPETPPEELHELALSDYHSVLLAVAKNPNAQPETLDLLVPLRFSSWNSHELAVAIARHPNTTPETLHVLAERLRPLLDNGRGHHMAFKAGVHVCSNPKTPIEALEALLKPDHVAMQFRKVVARETRRQDVIDILLKDRSEKVRRRAQETAQVLEQLSRE
jgi:hypothetical protein